MTGIANAAQHTHWNEVAGPKWVGLGDAMETRMQKVGELLLAHVGAMEGDVILDIGCGTGTTTLPLASTVDPQGHVVGIDISAPMLAVARRRVADQGLTNVSLLQADAQVYQFTSARFDRLVSRFGVMFFADPVAAFRNLCGAARPGGRLCFVCWAPLAENPHWQIPLDIVVARLGPPAPKPTHAPGPLALSDARYLHDILGQAGFEQITISREVVPIIGSTPEKEAQFACIMGPSGSLLDEHQADASVRHAVEQQIARAFAPFASERGMLLPASIYLVTARRPG